MRTPPCSFLVPPRVPCAHFLYACSSRSSPLPTIFALPFLCTPLPDSPRRILPSGGVALRPLSLLLNFTPTCLEKIHLRFYHEHFALCSLPPNHTSSLRGGWRTVPPNSTPECIWGGVAERTPPELHNGMPGETSLEMLLRDATSRCYFEMLCSET